MTDPYAIATAFLSGCLVTALGFVTTQYGKITKMDAKIDALTTAMTAATTRTCPLHLEVEKSLSSLQTELKMHTTEHEKQP